MSGVLPHSCTSAAETTAQTHIFHHEIWRTLYRRAVDTGFSCDVAAARVFHKTEERHAMHMG